MSQFITVQGKHIQYNNKVKDSNTGLQNFYHFFTYFSWPVRESNRISFLAIGFA